MLSTLSRAAHLTFYDTHHFYRKLNKRSFQSRVTSPNDRDTTRKRKRSVACSLLFVGRLRYEIIELDVRCKTGRVKLLDFSLKFSSRVKIANDTSSPPNADVLEGGVVAGHLHVPPNVPPFPKWKYLDQEALESIEFYSQTLVIPARHSQMWLVTGAMPCFYYSFGYCSDFHSGSSKTYNDDPTAR